MRKLFLSASSLQQVEKPGSFNPSVTWILTWAWPDMFRWTWAPGQTTISIRVFHVNVTTAAAARWSEERTIKTKQRWASSMKWDNCDKSNVWRGLTEIISPPPCSVISPLTGAGMRINYQPPALFSPSQQYSQNTVWRLSLSRKHSSTPPRQHPKTRTPRWIISCTLLKSYLSVGRCQVRRRTREERRWSG